MTTELLAIASKARSHPQHRFQNLYRLLDKGLLADSWGKLNKASAPGIDGLTADTYALQLTDHLNILHQRLIDKSYRAAAVKRVLIPKGNGKTRPLGLPVLEDKLVQQSVSQILQSIWEADFLPCSYGYRPNKSAHQALEGIRNGLQRGNYGYVVEADIKGFFNSMDHGWLVRMLEQRVDDKALITLIKQWLKAQVVEPDGSRHKSDKGSPQGGIISPVLANIYLHYVLDLWFEKVIRKKLSGNAMLVRYADDFIVAFQYKDDARQFYHRLPERLKKFGLALASDKTGLLRFSRFEPGRQRSIVFLGFEVYWGISYRGKVAVHRKTAREKQRASIKEMVRWIKYNRSRPIQELLSVVKRKLKGFENYFGTPGNSKSLSRLYYQTVRTLYKWLNRRSQRRSYNWSEFAQLLRWFNVRALTVRKAEYS
ncbi:group II intron reverse transcriptase/maturase [Amphritea pacifica]|uniref:Group II intron reverse transcriptase/maturase n=1 Tax=Amphritea pacifica TaxID=2811233 RepID=A0ABS2WE80_9GAMM|nr:group II intron reverse transcriptase/maturase [Amphritea pacifica]MBN0989856.1 group II intron reverse transcriptase/maturase [Amphritea pacifica]